MIGCAIFTFFSFLEIITKKKISNYQKGRAKNTNSELGNTFLITSYMGVTTLLRKDSDPPPYAGMTFSHVVGFTAPVNIPCNSQAILNKIREKLISHKPQSRHILLVSKSLQEGHDFLMSFEERRVKSSEG